MSWNVVFCEICIFVSDPESLTEFFSPGRTKRCLRRTAQLQLNFGDYSDYNADYHHHNHHEHNTHHDDQEGSSHCNTLITSLISGALARSGGWKPERDHPSLSDLYSTKENGDNFSFNISWKVQQTNILMDRTVCTSITANRCDSTPEIQRWISSTSLPIMLFASMSINSSKDEKVLCVFLPNVNQTWKLEYVADNHTVRAFQR